MNGLQIASAFGFPETRFSPLDVRVGAMIGSGLVKRPWAGLRAGQQRDARCEIVLGLVEMAMFPDNSLPLPCLPPPSGRVAGRDGLAPHISPAPIVVATLEFHPLELPASVKM